jgi:hypothetical protein
VPFGADSEWNGVSRGAVPTLATYLVRAGYRAVTVPTHRYLGAATGVGDGFEVLPAPAAVRRGSGTVSAPAALEAALAATASTPGPVLVWVHAMETHEPYVHALGVGPTSIDGQRAAVREVDRVVARAIRTHRARRGRPLVVAVFGDHGEEHGEHGGRFHSSSVHAEQVRVGMLLAGPGVPSATIDAPVGIAALPATIVELLGVETPATFVEPSLLACTRGDGACPVLAVSELRPRGAIGYTGVRYRLIDHPRQGVERLYDADTDPYERHDLAAERPDALAAMRALAREWDERN